MTESRIRTLEGVVNGFRIAGDGLIGGFPPSALRTDRVYSHDERVSDLEQRANGFTLAGTNGVQVAGSMKTGFTASVP